MEDIVEPEAHRKRMISPEMLASFSQCNWTGWQLGKNDRPYAVLYRMSPEKEKTEAATEKVALNFDSIATGMFIYQVYEIFGEMLPTYAWVFRFQFEIDAVKFQNTSGGMGNWMANFEF